MDRVVDFVAAVVVASVVLVVVSVVVLFVVVAAQGERDALRSALGCSSELRRPLR